MKTPFPTGRYESDNGQTPSVTPSERAPKKHGACHDHRSCTSHYTPVLHALDGREVCAGQFLSMPGRQSSLYEWLPIRQFPQPGPYAGTYCTKAHNQRKRNHRGGPRSRPDPLTGHRPGCLSPRHTRILTQHPPKRRRVACLTGARQH